MRGDSPVGIEDGGLARSVSKITAREAGMCDAGRHDNLAQTLVTRRRLRVPLLGFRRATRATPETAWTQACLGRVKSWVDGAARAEENWIACPSLKALPRDAASW